LRNELFWEAAQLFRKIKKEYQLLNNSFIQDELMVLKTLVVWYDRCVSGLLF